MPMVATLVNHFPACMQGGWQFSVVAVACQRENGKVSVEEGGRRRMQKGNGKGQGVRQTPAKKYRRICWFFRSRLSRVTLAASLLRSVHVQAFHFAIYFRQPPPSLPSTHTHTQNWRVAHALTSGVSYFWGRKPQEQQYSRAALQTSPLNCGGGFATKDCGWTMCHVVEELCVCFVSVSVSQSQFQF